MKKVLLACVMTAALASAATAQNASPAATAMTREQVESIIKEYIISHPEVILDAVEAYGQKQQKEQMAEQQEAVKQHLDWLENNAMLPTAGNPKGDVTIVEFYDYNCGYCKKAVADVMTLLEEDKNIRFVFVDTPILGQTSELAAKWSLAAKNQNAFLEYHVALMNNRDMIDETLLKQIGTTLKLDIAQLEKDANSEEIAKRVKEKSNKAAEMGIGGTPAFIIAGQLYGGYIGLDRMKAAVAEARQIQQEQQNAKAK